MSSYPKARKSDVVDEYHGHVVPDPYRWLEDTESDETTRWVDAQNRITEEHLGSIPERDGIRARMEELWAYTRYGNANHPVPRMAGDRLFYLRSDGLQNQPALWVEEQGEPRVLIDPNDLAEDGTVALTSFDATSDGARVAFALARGGSDWQEVRIVDVATGEVLADQVSWVKFARPAWTRDGSGFFYSRFPEPQESGALLDSNRGHQLCYHRLGTPQADDVLIYERPDEPEWGFSAEVTEGGRFAVVHIWNGSAAENRIYYLDLVDPLSPSLDGRLVPLLDEGDASYAFVAHAEGRFLVVTDNRASRKRLVAVPLDDPKPESWQTIVPQHEAVLEWVRLLGGRLVCAYLVDARAALRVFDLEGVLQGDIELPDLSSVAGLGGTESSPRMFYSATSFTSPTTVYRHDLDTGHTEPFGEPLELPAGELVTEQVFVDSKDGTPIPMFITGRGDLPQDGDRPVMMYGYGGFNVSLTPFFSVANLVWMEMGGLLAVPNLRGGGEYGEAWHKSGTRERKQNVFDDFQAAARYLIDTGYSRPDRLAMSGGSNGGLLVGACMTQQPELFAVALPAVGVLDMLRFHRFTIGWAWVQDYGSADQEEDFGFLWAYSPLHNIEDGVCYPATLVTTADRDDRVVPGHSFKFAARLQEAQDCDRPILIRVERKAGHGAGKPTTKLIAEAGDRLAFAWHHLHQGT